MTQIQPILCFKVALKELSNCDIIASRERLFHSEAPIELKHLLPNTFCNIGSAKSILVFLKL